MRIAHILWSLGTGGTENMVVDIASIQAESNDVAIFIINDWIEPYMLEKLNPKCKVFFAKRKPSSKNPIPLLKLNLGLKQFNPDVIHTHSNRAINCIKVCRNVPIVRTSHGLGNPCAEFSKYKGLIAISQAVHDDMNTSGYKSFVIPNGIRVSSINHKRSQCYNDNKLHFVMVSRLFKDVKGQDTVIEAVSKLKKSGISNFVLHLVGDGDDKHVLMQMTKQQRVDDLVIFEGRWDQQSIYKNLCEFDLFIQASRFEGFGLTIAEAMVAKVPVLVSDIAAPMEVIDNGRLGMHFHVGNSDDCANKINLYIEKGRNEKQVEDAFQYVVDNYDVSLTAKKYIEVYKSIVI